MILFSFQMKRKQSEILWMRTGSESKQISEFYFSLHVHQITMQSIQPSVRGHGINFFFQKSCDLLIVSLSKDNVEPLHQPEVVFFSVLDGGFAQIFEQISVYNSKDTWKYKFRSIEACFKMKRTSLPVDMHFSKTPLVKLPNITCISKWWPIPELQSSGFLTSI